MIGIRQFFVIFYLIVNILSVKSINNRQVAINNKLNLDDSKTKPNKEEKESDIFCIVNKKGEKELTYYGLMIAGAVARSVSATAVHPLNVIKTILQTKGGVMPELKWSVLSRGAGSQLIMSIPHGAVSFGVTEVYIFIIYSYFQ